MHCHLKPYVPTVVIGSNHEARNAPAYRISAKWGLALMIFNKFRSARFEGGEVYTAIFSETGDAYSGAHDAPSDCLADSEPPPQTNKCCGFPVNKRLVTGS